MRMNGAYARLGLGWLGVLLLLDPLSAAKADDFFGDHLSVRERHAEQAALGEIMAARDTITAVQLMMEYQAFAEGRCERYFEVETAAKNGDGQSQHMLSDLYHKGFCVPRDDARALQWALKAANGGYAPAYFDAGAYLALGVGAEKNPAAAIPWLKKAIATRIEAHYFLALIYWEGEGVTQNYQNAHEYAETGAQMGDPRAQVLTALFESQDGFAFTNHANAYKWALIVKASGQPKLAETLAGVTADLEKKLTPKQVAQAQTAAANWRPLKFEVTTSTAPIAVILPSLDLDTVLRLSPEQANDRLTDLALEKDRFLFYKAIAEDNVGVTALYIRAGASLETVSPVLHHTPLLYASLKGSDGVARYLISAGADINRSVNYGNDTPILLALSYGHRRIADFLIAQGARLDHPGIMYNAVEFNDPSFLALLKSKGVSIDQEYVGTPLTHAIAAPVEKGGSRCYEKSAAFLIENGARLDVRDDMDLSLLQRAIYAVNPTECVRLLLENGISQEASHGREPLLLSVIQGNAELVRLLLEHGAKANLRIELDAADTPMTFDVAAKSTVTNGGTLLQLAVVEQHAAIARLLVQHGAKTDQADDLGRTPMFMAESVGDSLMIAILKGEM